MLLACFTSTTEVMWKSFIHSGGGGGYLVQKTLRGCAANMGSKISLLVYEWPIIKCKIWYMNGSIFSKFGQIWAKIGSNLRKFWKKLVILFKIWPKIGPIGILMGYFFLKNWYLYGSTFKFCGGTSLPKPNLSTPRYTFWLITALFLNGDLCLS